MRQNLALRKQRAGQVTCGPSVSFASPDLAEQVAHLGFDWVWLDGQHGCWTRRALYDAIARFLPTPTAPIVRVESHDPGGIDHLLDMGAMGVIVPMVQNADEARAAVRAAYYPPLGRRSVGGVRPGLLGEGGMEGVRGGGERGGDAGAHGGERGGRRQRHRDHGGPGR